jgi:flagellar biosynthesis protein
MVDQYDDGRKKTAEDRLTPLNITKKSERQVAVAIRDAKGEKDLPQITAAGRGKIAEQILQIAFENGINVREDGPLANMLATIELDSPIPSEAFMAVAEILSYVYRANGEPNPFDAVLRDVMDGDNKKDQAE